MLPDDSGLKSILVDQKVIPGKSAITIGVGLDFDGAADSLEVFDQAGNLVLVVGVEEDAVVPVESDEETGGRVSVGGVSESDEVGGNEEVKGCADLLQGVPLVVSHRLTIPQCS